MRKLEWNIEGKGPDIVLLHGWGANSAVWQPVVAILSKQFTVHSVDLLGHGVHHDIEMKDLDTMCDILLADAPENATYVGWSLGGLAATNIAIKYPERVHKLITVASSPKFFEDKSWKGMLPKLARELGDELQKSFKLTLDGFLIMQTFGTKSANKDLKPLRTQVLAQPMASTEGLVTSLDIIAQTDLRDGLAQLPMPLLRLYGRLDLVVPKSVAKQVAEIAPQSEDYIFQNSRHAPFLSETELFCDKVIEFIEK